MMYFEVLFVGLIGAVIADLQPQGMSQALFATAFAMILVPAVALIIGMTAFSNGVAKFFVLHAGFAMLFLDWLYFFGKRRAWSDINGIHNLEHRFQRECYTNSNDCNSAASL